MKRTVILLVIFPFVAMLMTGCGNTDSGVNTGEIVPQQLDEPQLLIDFKKGELNSPMKLSLLPENRMAVLDRESFEVLVYTRDGSLQHRFGGEGKGPLEFVRPMHMSVRSNRIGVVDFDQRMVKTFDLEGNLTNTLAIEFNPHDGTVQLMGRNRYLLPAMGEQGSLLKVVDTALDSTWYMGEAFADPFEGMANLEEERQMLSGGEIPPRTKHEVTTYVDGDHIYVFVNWLSLLQKYTREGELVWETELSFPIQEAIFQETVTRTQEAENALPVLRYLSSFKVVDGEIYLLWNPHEDYPRKLMKYNSDGELSAIYHIPEEEPTYNNFAVDPASRTLYLTAIMHGQVYKTQLPE